MKRDRKEAPDKWDEFDEHDLDRLKEMVLTHHGEHTDSCSYCRLFVKIKNRLEARNEDAKTD